MGAGATLVFTQRQSRADSVTAAITAEESEQLFAIVRQLRARGTAIIFISHHLEEAFTIGDRVTVTIANIDLALRKMDLAVADAKAREAGWPDGRLCGMWSDLSPICHRCAPH